MSRIVVVNIGNTNTQYAVCDNGNIDKIEYVATDDLSSSLIPNGLPVAIASVVPEKNKIFDEFSPLFISSALKTPVDFSKIDHKSMGADRIANAVALANFATLPAMSIDFGTAITVEVLDENSTLAGGIIAPGRKLWRQSLHNYTALLPYIDNFSQKELPSSLGHTTKDAILAGCDIGIIGMVKGLIKKIKEDLKVSKCEVYATGGDADFFIANIPELRNPGIELTLVGIAAIYNANNS